MEKGSIDKKIWKKVYRRYWIRTGIVIVFIGLLLFLMGYMHEKAHQVIYGYYGLDSEIKMFSHFPDMITQAEGPCPVEECRLAQSIVDAVGYHIMVLIGILLLLFGVYVIKKSSDLLVEELKIEVFNERI